MEKYIADNWLGLTGLVVGVFGVMVGIVLYYRAKRIRLPAFVVHPLRTRIVDKRTINAPNLQVLHNGQPITGQNVTSVTIYFWNGGRQPISGTDVKQEYRISLGEGEDTTLIHANILKVTRPVCASRIVFAEPMGNRVAIAFDFLEYGDGVAVQLFFIGNPNVPIHVTGVCLDSEVPKNATHDYTSNRFDGTKGMLSGFLLGPLLVAFAVLLGYGVLNSLVRDVKSDHGWSVVWEMAGIIIATIFILILGLVGAYGLSESLRRFGSYYGSFKRLRDAKAEI